MPEPRRFEIVPEDEPTPSRPEPAKPDPSAQNAAVGLLMLALKTVSQRAMIAIADLFCLFTAMTVFWLWASIPDPNPHQITALTIYAAFILAANVIVRRK